MLFLTVSNLAFWSTTLSLLALAVFCSFGVVVLVVRDKNRKITDDENDEKESDEYAFMHERGIGS